MLFEVNAARFENVNYVMNCWIAEMLLNPWGFDGNEEYAVVK